MAGIGGAPDPYVSVRRIVIVLLTIFLGAMLILDVVIPTYDVNPAVTGTILGAIVALCGIDVGKSIGRKP